MKIPVLLVSLCLTCSALKAQFSNIPQTILESEICMPIYSLAADLDQDGLMDVLVSSTTNSEVYWYRNKGNQNYERITLMDDSVHRPRNLALIDAEEDGDQDIAILYSEGWGILINEGSEVFQNFLKISDQLDAPVRISKIDIDLDGDQDFVISSFKRAWLYLNKGNRVFLDYLIFDAKWSSIYDTYVVNLDSTPDIEIMVKKEWNHRDSTHYVYKYDTINQQLVLAQTVSVPPVSNLKIVDWDQDGLNDILALTGDLIWQSNLDELNFKEPNIAFDFSETQGFSDITFADFNQDGHLDFVPWNNGPLSQGMEAVYLGATDTNFTKVEPISNINTFFPFGSKQIIDMDGDQDLDILLTESSSNHIFWLEFEKEHFVRRHVINLSQIRRPQHLYQVDVDQDGDQDLLIRSSIDTYLSWIPNHLDQGWGDVQRMETELKIWTLFFADMDNDGDQDAFVTAYEDFGQGRRVSGLMITENQILDTPLRKLPIEFNHSSTLVDLDNDQDLDIVYFDYDEGYIAWLENNNLSFKRHLLLAQERNGYLVRVKDLNKDGYPDLIFSSEGSIFSSLYYSLNDQSGGFGRSSLIAEGIPIIGNIQVLDTKNDLIIGFSKPADKGGGLLRFTKNEALDSWKKTVVDSTGTLKLIMGDIDQDGDQDLLTASDHSSTNEIAYFLQDSMHQFTKYPLKNNPLSLTHFVEIGDFNQDGALDLIIGNGNCEHFLFYDNQAIIINNTQDFQNQARFRIYPNPVADVLTIETETHEWLGKSQFQLFNSVGALLKSERLENLRQQIRVSDLPKGIYFYTIRDLSGKGLASGKIVK